MKKFTLLLLLFVIVFSFGCGKKNVTEGEAAWEKFSSALEFTSSLQYYSIDVITVTNGKTDNGKLILSEDALGNKIAYKKNSDGEFYWVKGFTYYTEGGQKLKTASALDSFTDNSKSTLNWAYDMVGNVVMTDNVVTFSVSKAEFTTCNVSAVLGGVFLDSITVSVTAEKGGKTVSQSITYKYNNPGKKPTLEVPDLDEYHY